MFLKKSQSIPFLYLIRLWKCYIKKEKGMLKERELHILNTHFKY